MAMKVSNREKVMGVFLIVAIWASVAEVKAETNAGSSVPTPPAIVESVQGWNVSCQGVRGQRVCTVSEGLKWKANNHLAVLFEVRTNGANATLGQLTVPFGVDLPAGATLQVDKQSAWAPMGYRTCLPQGCLVPIEMKGSVLQALRGGKTLNVALALINGRGKTNFTLPLVGFDAAYARMESLAGQKG